MKGLPEDFPSPKRRWIIASSRPEDMDQVLEVGEEEGTRERRALLRGYIGGLFDGEGCINFRTYRDHTELVVQVEMSQKEPIHLLHHCYGGSITQRKREGKQETWSWYMTSHLAAAFLTDIGPLLLAKREDMEIALPIVALLLDRKKGSAYTPSERSALRKAVARMKRLRDRRRRNGRQ